MRFCHNLFPSVCQPVYLSIYHSAKATISHLHSWCTLSFTSSYPPSLPPSLSLSPPLFLHPFPPPFLSPLHPSLPLVRLNHYHYILLPVSLLGFTHACCLLFSSLVISSLFLKFVLIHRFPLIHILLTSFSISFSVISFTFIIILPLLSLSSHSLFLFTLLYFFFFYICSSSRIFLFF